MTDSIKIEELIEDFKSKDTYRGKIFAANLLDSFDLGLIKVNSIRSSILNFLSKEESEINFGGGKKEIEDRIDMLGRQFLADGVWMSGDKPSLIHHGMDKNPVLSRVVTWTDFYKWILLEPNVPEVPRPNSNLTDREVDEDSDKDLKNLINSGEWRDFINTTKKDEISFKQAVLWMAPKPKLNLGGLAKRHRDLIGLSHLRSGRVLIRLDFDLENILPLKRAQKFRPHGAGNGGDRFRVKYNGPDLRCGWGRTVDLNKIAKGDELNGVPELLTEGFKADRQDISAKYLGALKSDPERLDEMYFNILSNGRSFDCIVDSLKKYLGVL